MKRKLNDDERKFILNALQRYHDDLEYSNYLMEHAQLMLTQGLRVNYKAQLTDYQKKSRDIGKNIHELHLKIAQLRDQLENGVEEKNGCVNTSTGQFEDEQ